MARHPEVEAADAHLKELVDKGKKFLKGLAVRRPSWQEIHEARQNYDRLKFLHHPNYPIL